MYADIVATFALVIAGFSLVWQYKKSVSWYKPSITVDGRWMKSHSLNRDGSTKELTWGLEVDVSNVGQASTTLVDVYWEIEVPGKKPLKVRGSADPSGEISVEVIGELRVIHGVYVPPIPAQLAENDSLAWVFSHPQDNPLIKGAVRGRPAVVYVTRTKNLGAKYVNDRETAYGEWQLCPGSS
ncbi:hypothetical protein [Arthrobacter sp. NPDC089319]|uniref:hypothetical protein n=1 Tax=Arthrobacter sp. NPDC089319 TaxID=3155915 RepID=UPI00344534E2